MAQQTMFEVKHHSLSITTVEVEKESNSFVWLLGGERRGKSTEWSRFFPSKAQAEQFCREVIQGKIVRLERELESYRDRLAEL